MVKRCNFVVTFSITMPQKIFLNNDIVPDWNERNFSKFLLLWYDEHKRSLPWRGEKDVYKVWISEIILQQTQIAQGWSYYERFISAFPDVLTLASADEDAVLKLWEGLGYYSRARNLLKAARQIADNGGIFPTDYDGVRALCGVGDYTAAAICSMAYGLPVAAIDGNAFRVLTRVYGIEEPIDTTLGRRTVTALANNLISRDRAGEFNQAMMDLGAMVCKSVSPQCAECPLQTICVAFREERVTDFPHKSKTMQKQSIHLVYVKVKLGSRTMIRRRSGNGIWKGLYEYLLIENPVGETPQEWECKLLDGLMKNGKINSAEDNLTLEEYAKGIKHILTHRTITADFYILRLPEEKNLPLTLMHENGYFFVNDSDLHQYAFPSLLKKTILNKH